MSSKVTHTVVLHNVVGELPIYLDNAPIPPVEVDIEVFGKAYHVVEHYHKLVRNELGTFYYIEVVLAHINTEWSKDGKDWVARVSTQNEE